MRSDSAQIRESKLDALGGTVTEWNDGKAVEVYLVSPLSRCGVVESYRDADLDGTPETTNVSAWSGWNALVVDTQRAESNERPQVTVSVGEVPTLAAVRLTSNASGPAALAFSPGVRGDVSPRYIYHDLDLDGHFDVYSVRAPDSSRHTYILLEGLWIPVDLQEDVEAYAAAAADAPERWYAFESGRWQLGYSSAGRTVLP